LDISNLIDEKLSNVLQMQSLNGSNGAKYKDGELVTIDNYSGSWEVLGSYLVLTDNNTITILYQVKQKDRVMLVPSAFLGGGEE